MKRKLLWIIFNFGAAVLFWYGCIEGVQGAKNLLLFMVWFNFVVCWAILSDEVRKTIVEKGRTFPAWFTVTFDIAMTAALVWVGMWATGTAYALSALLQNGAYQKGETDAKKVA